MTAFFRFIASPTGRVIRVVVGLILIVAGIWWISGIGGWIVAIIGVVPLVAGALDWCVFAPLFGLPFIGEHLRHAVERK